MLYPARCQIQSCRSLSLLRSASDKAAQIPGGLLGTTGTSELGMCCHSRWSMKNRLAEREMDTKRHIWMCLSKALPYTRASGKVIFIPLLRAPQDHQVNPPVSWAGTWYSDFVWGILIILLWWIFWTKKPSRTEAAYHLPLQQPAPRTSGFSSPWPSPIENAKTVE